MAQNWYPIVVYRCMGGKTIRGTVVENNKIMLACHPTRSNKNAALPQCNKHSTYVLHEGENMFYQKSYCSVLTDSAQAMCLTLER